jgi:hypothetical protein
MMTRGFEMNEHDGTDLDMEDAVEIAAPASKSLSHRYLIGAALAHGKSFVRHTLESADIEATRGILSQAGALMKPLTVKLLDASRDYWLRHGVTDWGVVIDEEV